MKTHLLKQRYGKRDIHILHVNNSDDHVKDLIAGVLCEGAFDPVYTEGDNRTLLPTDSMKNIIYWLVARYSDRSIEELALIAARHFLEKYPQLTRILMRIREHVWIRNGAGSFHKVPVVYKTKVIATRQEESLQSGVRGLEVLKTRGSRFTGFAKDGFTTLQEAVDRLLKTEIQADWTYMKQDLPYPEIREEVRAILSKGFAEHESKSVQHTIYLLGNAVLKAIPSIQEIHLSLPNYHCVPVDLDVFGLKEASNLYIPLREPQGSIEATVSRDMP